MMRRKKNLDVKADIFEGTFLVGLMDLDEKELSEKLPEVFENEQILCALLPAEIKLYVLAHKKYFEYVKLQMDLFTTIIRPETADEAAQYLQKMVLALQKFEILRHIIWLSISDRIDSKIGFISLFNEYKSNEIIMIKKGFKVVVSSIDKINSEKQKINDTFKHFVGKAWEDFYFKTKNVKKRYLWSAYIKALNDEIARILNR